MSLPDTLQRKRRGRDAALKKPLPFFVCLGRTFISNLHDTGSKGDKGVCLLVPPNKSPDFHPGFLHHTALLKGERGEA